MDYTFSDALRDLGPNAAFRLVNGARPPSSYLWATILPERPLTTYEVKSGSMTIRSLMAGLVGMDSPYPETGFIETSTFLAQSAKLANRVDFPEAALRHLQDIVMRLRLGGGNAKEAVVNEIFNFTDKLLTQPHLDAMEWLRGQAIMKGAINWTYNRKNLNVDYGIPAANKLTLRTVASNDAYGGTSSKFWEDVRTIQKLLRYNVRAYVVHPDLLNVIVGNPANNILVLAQSDNTVTIQQVISQRGNNVASPDARDRVTLISYGLEGEVLDEANLSQTKILPFLEAGYLIGLGNNTGTRYVVGQGSTVPPEFELGYTHVAPTVEGGGAPGRWGRVYTMENRPWSLTGEAAQNALPVIEAPEKIVIAQTEMPA